MYYNDIWLHLYMLTFIRVGVMSLLPRSVVSLLPRIPGYCNSSLLRKLVTVGSLAVLTEIALTSGILFMICSLVCDDLSPGPSCVFDACSKSTVEESSAMLITTHMFQIQKISHGAMFLICLSCKGKVN